MFCIFILIFVCSPSSEILLIILLSSRSCRNVLRHISVAKTASKKIGAFICSMKFFSPELLCISKNLPYDHACYVWAGAPSCYLELLDKLQKQICRFVGPSLTASLESLVAHCHNVASWSIFYRYYFGRYSSELAQLVQLPYSEGSLLNI